MLVPRNVICWLISCVCVCVFVRMFSCLVDLHWLISACESSLFWDHVSSDHVIFNMCSFCYQTNFQKKIPPENHPLQPRSRFFVRKKTRCQKTGGFPSPVPYMTLHLANVSPDRLPTAHTCGLQLDLYLGLLLKTRNCWNLGGKKHETWWNRVPCPRIHVWNIYLHMYGKWPVCR